MSTAAAAPLSVSDFVEGLMSLYKELPCLWDTTYADYDDYTKKCIAYLTLKNKMLQIDKNASIDSTRRFLLSVISDMQGVYVKTTTNPSDPTIHTLWYKDFIKFFMEPHVFHDTKPGSYEFLEKKTQKPAIEPVKFQQIAPNSAVTPHHNVAVSLQSANIIAHPTIPNSFIIPTNGAEPPPLILIDGGNVVDKKTASTQTEDCASQTIFVVPTADSKLSYRNNKTNDDQRLNETSGLLETDVKNKSTDEERIYGVVEKILRNSREEDSLYGQHVAETIRKLPTVQKKLCQKLIDSVLFMAETGDLNESAKLVKYSS